MQLVDVLKENMIFLNFEANNKEEAIEKFINSLEKTGTIKEPNALKDALLEREKLGTTGIGNGIAMPHKDLIQSSIGETFLLEYFLTLSARRL